MRVNSLIQNNKISVKREKIFMNTEFNYRLYQLFVPHEF